MAAEIYIAFWWTCLVAFVCADQANITAKVGQENITLTCRAPNNKTIRAVKWSRADLGDEYVLLYRNEQLDPGNQHPSFRNRVDLQDRQMKNGNVSLVLKNVMINDAGTYECRILQTGTGLQLINIIHLHVDPPGQTGGDTEDGGKEAGSVGLKVGLIVFALLVVVVAAAGFLIYRKHEKTKSQDPYKPPAELEPV
ncbi:programmed cell death 1 ligand 1-like [Pelmatolapia mariae]|uniref:programmed cell death 1 ligand 1-like n=1 Tax=Pelmatolapia mariae TaxID=158779 RepID=UPI002FE63670